MTRYQEIAENLNKVQERIEFAANRVGRNPNDITLIVVTKNYPVSDIEILQELGVKDFGENRDLDGAGKADRIQGTWHFQGQIQSNKLKSICTWAQVIHSLDEVRHFKIISKEAKKPLDIFIQVSLDGDRNRGGVATGELLKLGKEIEDNPIHRLAGLMAVAPLNEHADEAFSRIQSIRNAFLLHFPNSTGLSAGMSNDFESAISFGATHLRIGSQILASR